MELYQLQYFLAIADTKGFTKAADRLFVSQPSLSAGIKKLEKELGVLLFDRGGRQVTLTPAGQFFHERARKILTEHESVIRDLQAFQGLPLLRLGALCTLRIATLAALIRDFRSRFPYVSIELRNGSLEEVQAWLQQGDIDVAMTLVPPDDCSDSCCLFSQSLLLAVADSHPIAQWSVFDLAELDDVPFIERIKCEILRPRAPQMFGALGIQPRAVYRADNEEWVISLVQSGMGITIMPQWRDLTGVTYLPIIDTKLSRSVGLQWRTSQRAEHIVQFCDYASEHDWQVR
ncbi:MAG: LysR family transcriptional regulator [Cyanobacteria bacterium P01_A01_bin.3]